MTEPFVRNPERYYPSEHAVIRARERNIDWEHVSETIEMGYQKPSHKEDCLLFLKEFPHKDKPLGVVANIAEGEIVTVEWREGEK